MAEVLANPKELTPQLVRAWELTLNAAGVTAAQVEPTVARLLQTQTFFPTPADFIKLLNPVDDRDAAEELAWQRVLDCIRAHGMNASLTAADLGGDGTALWAVDRMGWERLCCEMDTEKRAIWRAEFVRLYRAGKSTGAEVRYLAGAFEKQNALRGHDLDPALVGRPDWKQLPASSPIAPALPEPPPGELTSMSEMALALAGQPGDEE